MLTPEAADAVERLVARHRAPPGAGLRLSGRAKGDRGASPAGVRMELVDAPEPGDHFVHARVFVERGEVSELLADKLLDAELAGRDEIRFRLRPRLDRG